MNNHNLAEYHCEHCPYCGDMDIARYSLLTITID
nr:MAG TPA: restriction alleviation protein [Caudoviricetes sp.]